jgi:hypothetical protein
MLESELLLMRAKTNSGGKLKRRKGNGVNNSTKITALNSGGGVHI